MQTVTSKDGATIAYDTVGQGSAVILVAGAMGARRDPYLAELAGLLAPQLTVYRYDRRGRGDSTDPQPYAVEREIDDLEALVDVAGGSAGLFGLSSGGALAAFGLFPIAAIWFHQSPLFTGFACVVSALIWFRHKDNLVRLWSGTESRIGQAGKS